MKRLLLLSAFLFAIPSIAQEAKHVQLLCHRTANKDAPENTMEALQQAALLGCDVIEIDVRQTLDGVLILNHDGLTERVTDGHGKVEESLYGDLQLRDAGSWMGNRWTDLRVARFDEALLFAREHHVQLILDIKERSADAAILRMVDDLKMQDVVRYSGRWEEIREQRPTLQAGLGEEWFFPEVTKDQIAKVHTQGKRVIVNFAGTAHDMDVAAMRAAVESGADGINVDYPRMGADAVGRPVEGQIGHLIQQASQGSPLSRISAITSLADYRGFPLQKHFLAWLQDADAGVSRAAAVALVSDRPAVSWQAVLPVLQSPYPAPRANAAWALGVLQAPASAVVPLLSDSDSAVLQEALFAVAGMSGTVPAEKLEIALRSTDVQVQAAAAVAIARKQPEQAPELVLDIYRHQASETLRLYKDWQSRGKPRLSHEEVRRITDLFRSEMKLLQAIRSLPGSAARSLLEEQAFHSGDDFLENQVSVAAFQLWDRIGDNPEDAVRQLGSADSGVADRAEWMLTMADVRVEPAVRKALTSQDKNTRERAARITAHRGDSAALPILSEFENRQEAEWSADRIHMLERPQTH